jgi:hypothetical protein
MMDDLDIVLLSVTALSVLGTFGVFTSYLTFPDLRTPIYRIVTYLALSDFIWEAFVVVCLMDNDPSRCSVYAFLITGLQLSSVFWTTYIAYTVKDSILTQREHLPRFSWWVYPLVCFGVPVSVSTLPFLTESYDIANLEWCMIARSSSSLTSLWFIVIFNFPLLACLCYCAAAYGVASKAMRFNLSILNLSEDELEDRLFYIRKLKIFPLILALCWLPGLMFELVLFISGLNVPLVDKALAVVSCLQGVLNAFAYSYSSVLGFYLRSRFCPKKSEGHRNVDDILEELLRI